MAHFMDKCIKLTCGLVREVSRSDGQFTTDVEAAALAPSDSHIEHVGMQIGRIVQFLVVLMGFVHGINVRHRVLTAGPI
jgi:hypothetical protein